MIDFDKFQIGDIVVFTYSWGTSRRVDYVYGEVLDVNIVDGITEVTIKDIFFYRKTNDQFSKAKPITDTIEGCSNELYKFLTINDDRFHENMDISEFVSTIENLFPEYFI